MENIRRLLTFLSVPFLLIGIAHAQDLGTAVALVDPAKDTHGSINQFWAALQGHQWGIAAVIGTMLLVALIRFAAPKVHGAFGAWVNTTRVSATLALLSGGCMALAAQLLKGGKFSPDLLIYGLGAGVTAIGGYNAFFDLLFPADKQAKPSLEGAEVLAKKDADKENTDKKDPTDPNIGGGTVVSVIFFLISGSGLLVYLLTVSGCASGVDGLRQACSNADAVLTGAYQSTATLYKAKQEKLRSTITVVNLEQAKATLASDAQLVAKVFAALDAATDAKKGVCELAPAIEAGAKKDIPVLVGKLLQIGLDVRNVVADLQKLTP